MTARAGTPSNYHTHANARETGNSARQQPAVPVYIEILKKSTHVLGCIPSVCLPHAVPSENRAHFTVKHTELENVKNIRYGKDDRLVGRRQYQLTCRRARLRAPCPADARSPEAASHTASHAMVLMPSRILSALSSLQALNLAVCESLTALPDRIVNQIV